MGTILTILKNLPDLITVIKQILAIVTSIEDWAKQRALLQDLTKGLKQAHDTKDTSALESIFNPK